MKRFDMTRAWMILGVGIMSLYSAEALAQAPSPQPAAPAPTFFDALIEMLPLIAMMYLVVYFMVIRPQERKTKAHKTLIETLKRGDFVVTSSGIVGKVGGVEKDYVVLEIAPSVKIKVLQSHVTRRETEESKPQAA